MNTYQVLLRIESREPLRVDRLWEQLDGARRVDKFDPATKKYLPQTVAIQTIRVVEGEHLYGKSTEGHSWSRKRHGQPDGALAAAITEEEGE